MEEAIAKKPAAKKTAAKKPGKKGGLIERRPDGRLF